MTIFICILLILLVLLIFELIREQLYFKVTKYVINNQYSIRGRLLFISDLHSKSYGPQNRRLIDKIAEASPDVILIGGDMITSSHPGKKQVTLDFLQEISSIAPCYYSFGNHEGRMLTDPRKYKWDIKPFLKSVTEMGIHILDNHSETISINGTIMNLTGLTLPSEHYKRFRRKPVTVKDLYELIDNKDIFTPNDTFDILLSHDPSPYETYDKLDVELILSGHYHGGAVRFGQYGMITPQLRLFSPRSYGLNMGQKNNMIVTSGIGTHTLPLRLFNPGEIVIIDLQ